ncbi:MAG: alpha/beta hydrolase [bacterium]|nr:alpha/beta hydrolase [bacterium]
MCFALALFFAPACGSSLPLQLFFRPSGTTVEVYKRRPVPLKLVVYPRPPGGTARGAVIFIHGGGWSVAGAGIPTYQDWHEPLQKAGLRAFALEHRVPPRYRGRDHINDCVDAVRYIERNAQRFGIPADRMALVGFSSGGHLAVMTGLTLSRPRPGMRSLSGAGPVQAVVAYYAPLDPERLLEDTTNPELRKVLVNYLPRFSVTPTDAPNSTGNQLSELRRSFYERALTDISPMHHMHAFAPPMYLLHGVRDELIPVEQSRAFRDRANSIKPGAARLEEVGKGDHHFIRSRNRWARAADEAALDFIQERFEH